MPPELEPLRASLARLGPLPPAAWEPARPLFYMRKLGSGEVFVAAGDKAQEVGLLASGLLRAFYTDTEGRQTVKGFVQQGQFAAPYASLLQGLPANITIVAERESALFCIRWPDLQKLYGLHPAWQEIGRRTAETLLLAREKREHELLMLSALERYELFLKDFSALAGEIPQWQIASYLGITPVALSRIRRKRVSAAKKK